jgi:hypothetical protein
VRKSESIRSHQSEARVDNGTTFVHGRAKVFEDFNHAPEVRTTCPALGKERSFGDRVRGQCSPLTFPVVAVSPQPRVSPETRGGGGLGGGEGTRTYEQDTPRGIPRRGLKMH